ncbi:xylosyltransferase oxt-like isoform X2 [Artemia franciscana]|uniref:xylosyltransferase oxt-like isoform X2 n=1 Tax=Artemia franciscana TaxID=6661 RepID=UPI0032DAAD80
MMYRVISRSFRKKKNILNLFLVSLVFFICLNVSMRGIRDSPISDDEVISIEPESKAKKKSYEFLDELAKPIAPDTRIEDIPSYKIPCNTISATAKNALKRTKTNRCRQMIADAACKLSYNVAIPTTVHNTCKRFENATSVKIRHHGCHKDDRKNRVLGVSHKWFHDDNTVELCIDFCRDGMGAAYAGVEFGAECHCGYKINSIQELNYRQCNIACPGDSLQNCGGDLAINVFSTGATEIEPPKLPNHETSPAVLAFHIGLNGRKIRQIKQMLQALYSPKHYYLLHVDLRQDYLYNELKKLEDMFPNVRLQKHRIKGIWGAPSLYQLLRHGLKELLEWAPDWDFFINLSESCFPLQKLDKIEKYYGANQGRNFFWSYSSLPDRRLKQNRLQEHFVECDDYVYIVGERKWPKNLRVDSGADWYTMHRSFAEFVSDRNNPLIQELEKIQNFSFVPTENFFHMALQNSQFCSTRWNENHRILSWGDFPDGQCNHNEFGDYGGCSPQALKFEDIKKLKDLEGYKNFFARKFDSTVSQTVLTAMDEEVFGEYHQDTPALDSFWECIYHHQYDSNPSMVQFSKYLFSYMVGQKKIDFIQQNTKVIGLEEINTFYHDDRYEGSLIKYRIKNPSLVYEVDMVPRRQMIRPDMRRLKQGRLKMTFLIFHMEKDLQPGVWSLLIETFGNLVGYVDFPVFPETLDTKLNNPESLLRGPASVGVEINEFLSNRNWPEIYSAEEMAYFLLKKFYRVNSHCVLEDGMVENFTSVTDNCKSTKWSSLSPDPKSEFIRLNG